MDIEQHNIEQSLRVALLQTLYKEKLLTDEQFSFLTKCRGEGLDETSSGVC